MHNYDFFIKNVSLRNKCQFYTGIVRINISPSLPIGGGICCLVAFKLKQVNQLFPATNNAYIKEAGLLIFHLFCFQALGYQKGSIPRYTTCILHRTHHSLHTGQHGTPIPQHGTPTPQYGTPAPLQGTSKLQHGTSTPQHGTSQYGTSIP